MANPEENGQVVHWDDLEERAMGMEGDQRLLSAGDIVVFDNLTQVDGLTDMLMQVIHSGRHFRKFDPEFFTLDPRGHHTYAGWKDGNRHAVDVVKVKNFYGKLLNMQSLMLDDVPVYDGYRYAADDTPRVISYGFFADMHSTGRGMVGRVAKLIRVRKCSRGNNYFPLPTVSYVNLPTNNAEQAIAKIRDESIEVSHEVVVSGLKHMYAAGLPSLGKKR